MTEKNTYSEDQIDLTGIKNVLFGLLRAFFIGLSFCGFCLRKYRYLLTLAFVLGMGFGYIYYATKPSHYKASMIVQYNQLTKRTYSEMVDQLNRFLGTVPRDRVAREMQIPANVAGKLLSITAYDMEDRSLAGDTSTKLNQPFKIVANVQDDFDFALDTLQTGVLNYLNTSPYLGRLAEVTKKANETRLATIERDLAKLDTLKTAYNNFLASTKISSTFYSNAVNPAEFYAQTLLLLKERDVTLEKLDADKAPVVVVDGFKLTDRPQAYSIPRVIVLFGLILAFAAFLIFLAIETKKRVMGPAPSLPAAAQK
ncbi:MAG TPA: hypothetical protein VL727_10415 [Puia sp.]|jgi:hypothetical protein|nr:hypothetical protein [Puia sp.]